MRYKVRRLWRHFKYWLLKRFFGQQELKKFLDIDRLDFEDAVRLIEIRSEVILTHQQYNYFTKGENVKYGLQYELARRMAEILAKHVKVSKVLDIDTDEYTVIGGIVIAEAKEKR